MDRLTEPRPPSPEWCATIDAADAWGEPFQADPGSYASLVGLRMTNRGVYVEMTGRDPHESRRRGPDGTGLFQIVPSQLIPGLRRPA